MRRPLTLIAVTALSLAAMTGLAGCSGSDSPSACSYTEGTSSGLEAISVSGSVGAKPSVDMPTPFKASSNQNRIIHKGSGQTTAVGDFVTVDASFFNGSTGELITATDYVAGKAAVLQLSDTTTQPVFVKALACVPTGSRIVSVFGNDKTLDSAFQLPEGTSIVAVFDVVDAYLGKANGTPQVVPDGFPMVVLADSGQPGLTFLSGAKAPTDLRVAAIKKGTGATITAQDTVVLQYTGWLWPTDSSTSTQPFDSSWGKGQPAAFPMTGGTITGFSKAIVGQTVGSQIEVIIPPADGYGAQGTGSIPPNSTLVFVIDILGVAK